MSSIPPPTQSAPPPPPPTTASSSKRGCLIAVLVTAVVLLVCCGGACFYLMSNPGKMAAKGMRSGRADMIGALASDVQEPLRTEFATEYDANVAYIETLDMAKMKELGPGAERAFEATKFVAEAVRDKVITSDEAQRFVELSRAGRGATP